MKEIPLSQGEIAIVDDKDYEWLNQWKWYLLRAENTLYAVCQKLRMHRLILNVKPGEQVDHINGNGLDNRRLNLRICTRVQNGMNRGKNKNNTSGFKGVFWRRDCKKWRVQIGINNKIEYLGTFADLKDAVRAYDEAAKKYHGEFARVNTIPPRKKAVSRSII